MKKNYISFLTVTCLFISGLASAQQFKSQSATDLRMKLPSGEGSRAQNVFVEVGLGATILATGGSDNSFLFEDNNSNVIGTMSFSYRLQPVNSGFSLRAGLTPIFNGDFFLPYFGGLSLGYTF